MRRQRRRRKKFSDAILGEAAKTGIGLKLVLKKIHLHVTRFHPDTSSGDVKDFLSSKLLDAECESIKLKFPDYYSSFKVSVDLDEKERVADPKLWPRGIAVSRFFPRERAVRENNF